MEDLLNYDQMVQDMPDSSFENTLRCIFNKGEYFCNRCMDMLSNYIDLDRLMNDPAERDPVHVHVHHSGSKPKPVLQIGQIKGVSYFPRVERKSRPTGVRDSTDLPPRGTTPPVPTSGSSSAHNYNPSQGHQVTQPPPNLAATFSIFQDEKFKKLCSLLETSLPTLEAVLNAPPPQPQVIIQQPALPPVVETPTIIETPKKKVKTQAEAAEEYVLGERIRELTHDLKLSQLDLKDHQIAITALCTKNKELQERLSEAEKSLNQFRVKAKECENLKVRPVLLTILERS